ncbi:MAG: hypothetical protein AB7Q37_17075 [Pyrinomonadaceae bacterium]
MQIQSRSKRTGARFYDSLSAREFESKLEIPSGKDPTQNAWLTITLNYSLNFADSKNRVPGLIVTDGSGNFFAKPSNPTAKAMPIKDWDFKSQTEFARKFAKAESFWNHKFLLITPQDYDAFDFTSFGGPGWICRPNVICLFRLGSGGSPNHLKLNVVRAEGFFRSDQFTYDDGDVNDKTVWHELGHSLDQLHIRALLGDPFCTTPANINHNICYTEPKGVKPNIQGTGTGLIPQNAKAWHELIAQHTETSQSKWRVSMNTKVPPRKLQMGFQVRGVMPKNW